MIYSLSGRLVAKRENFAVVDVGGVHYRVFVSPRTHQALPDRGEELSIFTYLNVKEDALDLFGFLSEYDRNFFTQLVSVSGVGPRTALGVMAVAPTEQLVAAIIESKADLLTRASGIGKKTAERVVLELKTKLAGLGSGEIVKGMESDVELEEALVSLGYSRLQARRTIEAIGEKETRLEDRLKQALKIVKN
ncbi:MAG: Holliday junction branch migration protein RuvA [Patescibacteria group bacterium]